jgi:hypothetical protein
MLYHLRHAGGPPLKRPYGHFRDGLLAGCAAYGRLTPLWIPHAVRLCSLPASRHISRKNDDDKNKNKKNIVNDTKSCTAERSLLFLGPDYVLHSWTVSAIIETELGY